MPFKNQRNSREDNSKNPRKRREDNSRGPRNNRDESGSRGPRNNRDESGSRGTRSNRTESPRVPRNSSEGFSSKDGSSNRKSSENTRGGFRDKPDFNKDNRKSFSKKTGFGKSFDKSDDRTKNNDFDRGKDKPLRKRFEESEENDNNFKYGGRRKFVAAKKPASKEVEDDGLIRLNRYISNSGICSRRKADELIAAGVISVNGEVVTELGTKVDPAKDEIRYNDERLKREKMVYVLLNKPKDYITTTDDPQERRTVMQLVSKATKERIYPVGRLDRNTTGLLLLTNDGNLAEKLSHPRNNITKIYQVELSKSLTQGDFNKIEFGLELEDGFIKPDDISYVQGASKREVGIQIHSGKNRIVRRIFESLGYEVVKLDRVVYANLTKKDLPRGRWRYLEEKELIQLKHLIK